jgi:hypothetical protein
MVNLNTLRSLGSMQIYLNRTELAAQHLLEQKLRKHKVHDNQYSHHPAQELLAFIEAAVNHLKNRPKGASLGSNSYALTQA